MKNYEESITALATKLDGGEKAAAADRKLVEEVVRFLDQGTLRVAHLSEDGTWVTQAWVKQAILLYLRTHDTTAIEAGDLRFLDKVPVKTWTGKEGVRVVPPAVVRHGAFVEAGAILMPSYVNIGAYVGGGTMVDTWATVGSCAQIGKNVHLSGGAGIGGVLEPLQASPVIIEDDVFIGSRAIVVEGVIVEKGAVLAAGVVLTGSTKIVDVTGSQEKILRGRVPANAVLIPGSIAKEFPAGTYGTSCALLIGYRGESTDRKTSLNQALRDFQISV